jgi:hypothetical protein
MTPVIAITLTLNKLIKYNRLPNSISPALLIMQICHLLRTAVAMQYSAVTRMIAAITITIVINDPISPRILLSLAPKANKYVIIWTIAKPVITLASSKILLHTLVLFRMSSLLHPPNRRRACDRG